ncbi:hypothetical protein METBIDRAFT_222185 [Metschnikowia bicuspidata var. bicuspidata NRRL YB-4993]|uniref:HECT-type E3 ubiquitin transferase n=1 Tax=Metschnikowia bicuspidata var. bicuspidata NRRL YB-4993 TaxID=869754 RepID=A0A1A0H643_9ASCO|nr:hypothetical protein METBIDRAFT_222185 [Metschnikowia bicuspidata var. bicuspidata NRRL YB-4993]OBA19377.1 hypothetical protein METBIDRAFT_222185 [Metschnikowia bicuspidata var. bicuspidata NRRL YB-4993]
MLNFTGTTKKRVVNLGDKRGGNKGRSFLEQAKNNRLQRESARQREKRIILIQLYVRSLLVLRSAALELSEGWKENGIGNNPGRWCLETCFIIRYGSQQLLSNVYHIVNAVIDSLEGIFSSHQVAMLIKALNTGLSRGILPGLALDCLLRLLALYPIPKDVPNALNSLIGNLTKVATSENMHDVIQLIFEINSADSIEAFVRFLANVPRGSFLESKRFSKVALECLLSDPALSAIRQLSDFERVSLLLNVLKLNLSHYATEDFLTHAKILSQIDSRIVSESQSGHLRASLSSQMVTATSLEFDILLGLLSSSYVRLAFNYLCQVDAPLCVKTMYQLLHLFPQSRTSLCMIMSITPNLPRLFFDLSSKTPQYIVHASTEGNTEEHVSLEHIPTEEDRVLFEELIYTYNQILSSWLVVSKDTESFKGNNFPLTNVKLHCRFLKSFCYSLLKSSRGNDSRLTDLKEISISVLNQLYIKNLRLQFLPQGSWKVEGLELHLRDMVLELEDNEDLDSSDEENEENDNFEHLSSSNSRLRFGSHQSFEKEVLNKVPFFVDFTTRVKIFQNSIQAEKAKSGLNHMAFFSDDLNLHKLAADINRESLIEDAFENFFRLGKNFKNPLLVTFYNEHGPEAGIDGGGLTKEFLTSVVQEGFNPRSDISLFKESSSCSLYPNDDIFWNTINNIQLPTQRKRLMYTKFLGMIIGKCLYEEILIDITFVPSFLSKWRVAQNNLKNSIDDLVFLDPELYTNLNKLLEMNEGQLESLDLNFTIDEVIGNSSYLFDLLPPNGAQETVTQSNRLSYIHKVSHFKLNQSLHLQTKHFLEGLFQLIKPSWLNMVDPLELQMLISGGHDIDLEDWKFNVRYGGYFDDDLTIKLFWQVVEEMTAQERCDLVKFVTSVARAPLLGFGAMYPKFAINNAGSPDRLPTASTCVNLLKLPDYKDKVLIRQKLLYSVYANSGFDLS